MPLGLDANASGSKRSSFDPPLAGSVESLGNAGVAGQVAATGLPVTRRQGGWAGWIGEAAGLSIARKWGFGIGHNAQYTGGKGDGDSRKGLPETCCVRSLYGARARGPTRRSYRRASSPGILAACECCAPRVRSGYPLPIPGREARCIPAPDQSCLPHRAAPGAGPRGGRKRARGIDLLPEFHQEFTIAIATEGPPGTAQISCLRRQGVASVARTSRGPQFIEDYAGPGECCRILSAGMLRPASRGGQRLACLLDRRMEN